MDLTSVDNHVKRTPSTAAKAPPNQAEAPLVDEANVVEDPPQEEQPDRTFESALDQNQVQILDLHSDSPIISFNDTIHSCQWADMIGTEMLFTTPDPRADLPAVRQGEGYSLLAANSVKIIGSRATMSARDRGRKRRQLVEEPIENNGSGVVSPTQEETNGAVKNQKRFLDRIAAAKRRKGETDQVTVHSRPALNNLGWRARRNRMSHEP